MAAGSSVDSILAGAKETLNKANAFSEGVNEEAHKNVPPPKPHITAAPVKHEYSEAPYSLAKELKAKKEMVDNAHKALNQ